MAEIDAEPSLGLPHDIIGEVVKPNFRSGFIARFIFLDSLPEVGEILRFFVRANLSYPHCVPGGDASLGSLGKPWEDRFRSLVLFPEVGKGRFENERSGQTDDVDRAAGQGFLRLRARFESARLHQGFGGHRAGTLGKFGEIWPTARTVRGGLCAGKVCPTANVDQVDRRAVQRRHYLKYVVFDQPAL